MTDKKSHHLEELKHEHYYDIAGDEPKVLNWNIADEAGKKIGEVKDVLFDKEAEKARYLITNLKDGMLEEDRRVLVPIGRARLNTEDKRIVLPAVTLQQLASLPDYTSPADLNVEDEQRIRQAFAGTGSRETKSDAYSRKDFYEHEDFREENYHRKR